MTCPSARRAAVQRLHLGRLTAMLMVLGTCVLGAAGLTLANASPAQAHDVLRGTSPADGASVATLPSEVVLTFDQPALAFGTGMVVTDPDGKQVQVGKATLIDNTVHQGLGSAGAAGRYTVLWRATSADGHPISGNFAFTVQNGSAHEQVPTTTPAPRPASTTSDSRPLVIGVAVVVVLLLVVVGALVARSRRRRNGFGGDLA